MSEATERKTYTEFCCPQCKARLSNPLPVVSMYHYHAGHGNVRCTPVERKK